MVDPLELRQPNDQAIAQPKLKSANGFHVEAFVLSLGTKTHLLRFASVKAPASGAFVVVIGMLETSDFFQEQAKQCRTLAARAADKNDREFWLRLAHRWEGLLRSQRRDDTAVETVQKVRFERPIFAKRRRAA